MKRFFFIFLLCGTIFTAVFVRADEYTSPSYRVLDPVMFSSGYGTSTSFGLWGSVSQPAIATSTSALYEVRSGFLYFPFVTTPVLTASLVGTSTAVVTWTPAQAYLGWSVGSYTHGIGTNSSGPYSYTPVGTDLVATSTGLTLGTTYYFVTVVNDAFGNAIGTSSPASLAIPGSPPEPGDDDDGGTSGTVQTATSGTLSIGGFAHPDGTVFVLRDGVRVGEIPVANNGTFLITLSDIPFGSYNMTLYGVDNEGVKSGVLSFPVVFYTRRLLVSLQGIFLPPTISFEKTDDTSTVRVVGSTLPNSVVVVTITRGGAGAETRTATASNTGFYEFFFSKEFLTQVQTTLRSLAAVGDMRSPFGVALKFVDEYGPRVLRGDFNNNGRVNLTDFSILAYWHDRENVPARFDLNSDGEITLADFSILTFFWTG
ncbi:MAG: dockerin type I domain-containing protein [Candidatus Campbellbacteria bacterium]|nr:dockerin type I domain-containing protein [Candidatus Campbellbacteria bacterium]